MYYIYVLRCEDNSLYTGITNDLKKRISEHYYQKKQSAKYTKSHRVVGLEAVFCTDDKSTALKYEKKFKKMTKRSKETLINSNEEYKGLPRLACVKIDDYI